MLGTEIEKFKMEAKRKIIFFWLPEIVELASSRKEEKKDDWRQFKVLFAVGIGIGMERRGKGKYPGGVFIIIFVIINLPDDDVILWCGDMKELSFAPWYGDIRKSLWYLYEASVACGCVAAASPAKSNLYA